MKPVRLIMIALALAALAARAIAQDDPFAQLKSYDFQNRKPVVAIHNMIRQSLTDKARLAAIEKNLIGVLQDSSTTFAGKQEACKMLWVIGTARSVPALAKMLPDEKLGNIARYALERNPDPAAGKALRSALAAAKGRALTGVINSLGDRGDPEAAPLLKRSALSPDKIVSESAVVALGKIGTPGALVVLQSHPARNTLIVCQAILRCADRLAASGRKAEAERVYASMAAKGRPSVARATAIQGLAAMHSPKAGAAALASLKSGDPYVQRVAARVCGTLPGAQTLLTSLAFWQKLPAGAQTVLLTAWADRREPGAATVALAATESRDQTLRIAAIQAAARCGGAKAVPRLAEMAAKGPDNGAAREALAGMPGREAEQVLLQIARQGQPETRAAVLGILSDRPDPAAMSVLMEAAHGSDNRAASEALKALGRIGDPQTHTEIVRILVATQDDGVRDAAREAVVAIAQRIGDRDRAAAPVLAAFPEASTEGKCALLPVLAEIGGGRALDELTKAADSGEGEVKRTAIATLAETWSDSRPLPTLMGIAKSDPDKSLRVQALRGCIRLIGQDNGMPAEEKVSKLSDALAIAERPEEKKQVLSVLRDCRVPSAVELAAAMLDDTDLFPEAADTVLYLAAPQRRDNRNLRAVKGEATDAALDKIIANTKDDNQKALAQKLKG
jgi:HEAT repeat protein